MPVPGPHVPCLPCSGAGRAAAHLAAPPLRCPQDERRQLLQQMQQLQAEVDAQQEELAQYAGTPGAAHWFMAAAHLACFLLQGCREGLLAVPGPAAAPSPLHTARCPLRTPPPRAPPGNDPDRYDNLKQAAQLACDSANRWIDNIDSLRVGGGGSGAVGGE